MKQTTFEDLPVVVSKLIEEVRELKILLKEIVPEQIKSDKLLSVKEVAKITGFTDNTIYGYCSRNEIPYYKKGGRSYFFKNEIFDWIKQGEIKTQNELEAEVDNYITNKKR